MSTTQSEINALQAKHDEELRVLKEKAEKEKSALEAKKQAELDDIAKHGRQRAIDALIALDDDGQMLTSQMEDRNVRFSTKIETICVLYLIVGKEKYEIKVEEAFARTYGYSSKKGESKGFWYSLDSYRLVSKKYRWKKPEVAYAKLKEIRNDNISANDFSEQMKIAVGVASMALAEKYPDAKITKDERTVSLTSDYGKVIFSVRKDGSYSVDKIPEYYFHASIKDSVVDLLMRGSKL